MADLLTEFTTYVATAAGLSVGATLFRGGLPAEQTAAAVSAIIPTGGVAGEYSPLDTRTYQVLSRSIDAHLQPALDQAEAIRSALLDSDGLPKRVVAAGAYQLTMVDLVQPPADIGLDDARRRRVVFNVQVIAAGME